MANTAPKPLKLLDMVREKIRAKHYSRHTEESYTQAKSPLVKTSLMSRLSRIQFDAPEVFPPTWNTTPTARNPLNRIFLDTLFVVALANRRD